MNCRRAGLSLVSSLLQSRSQAIGRGDGIETWPEASRDLLQNTTGKFVTINIVTIFRICVVYFEDTQSQCLRSHYDKSMFNTTVGNNYYNLFALRSQEWSRDDICFWGDFPSDRTCENPLEKLITVSDTDWALDGWARGVPHALKAKLNVHETERFS